MIPELKQGDIFFTDNFSTASKIVKFLMTAPTLWQYIWRAIRGTQNEVRFYHAGMVIRDGTEMIEQQSDVRIRPVEKIFKKNYVVWRKKNLTADEAMLLEAYAIEDLGEGYDIVLCIGKLFTWLTWIPIFTRLIQSKEKEICVTRVAYWYFMATGETFGCKTWHEVTTDIIDDYCIARPHEWEQVAINYEDEE